MASGGTKRASSSRSCRARSLKPAQLAADETVAPAATAGPTASAPASTERCAGTAYGHNGGGGAWFASSVFVCGDGSRVAVLLLNGRAADNSGDKTSRPR